MIENGLDIKMIASEDKTAQNNLADINMTSLGQAITENAREVLIALD